MKKLIHSSENIMCMSDVRGKYIKVEHNIPFSFYYSARNSSHGPRVKVSFNPNRLRIDQTGTLKLCDDWRFDYSDDNRINSKQIKEMKKFFKKYLILFLLVWDMKTEDEPSLGDYLEGDITLSEFIEQLIFYSEYTEQLDQINTIEDLEKFCRSTKVVNFYGN